ncbi:MAG: PAS domain S-box protein [Candidatus Deferrimicrobiaceae bacterium]
MPHDPKGAGWRRYASAQVLAAVLAGIVVVVYVVLLLLSNYRSERDLQRNLLAQFEQETKIRAKALEYFLSTAKENINNLATSREIFTFFENRDLGMSMEYGLKLSLFPIRERFLGLVRRTRIGGVPLYSRVVLVDREGGLLVDTDDPPSRSEPVGKAFVAPRHSENPVIDLPDGNEIVVSHPFIFKDRYEGQIIASIPLDVPYASLLREEQGSNHLLYIGVSGTGEIRVPNAVASVTAPSHLPPPGSIPPGKPVKFTATTPEGTSRDMLACRQPVEGTPISVIQVLDATEILGHVTPTEQVGRMGLAALAILLGTIYTLVLSIRSLVLKHGLDGSLLREKEIQRKNEQLQVEIAERIKAEEAQARLGMAVEQAAEVIMISDTDGTIQYVNPAFERISGYSREEAIGKNPRILKSGRHEEAFYRVLWDTLARGETWSGNLINRRKDGKLFEEVAVISPVRDAGGTVVNYVAVKRDVTHEVQLEEELRQMQKMEAVGKLAGGIAHDFNNLMTVINGFSELLQGRPGLDSTCRKEVDEIRKAGDRAAALTRQLLAFSRRQMLQPKTVDLGKVTSEMDNLLRRLIGEDIELVTVAGKALWNVKVDPGQIEQVVMNLVVNSRDAMPSGGRITIETANAVFADDYLGTHPVVRPGSYVMLAVSDTGIGMDEETKGRIFEPFFTTKEQGKGTGLGLSTVYGIVKQSKGYIWAYSEVGKGTTFKVYLPQAEEGIKETSSPGKPVRAGGKGCETLLLAEDEDLVRELARTILEEKGYRVLDARDGHEAVEIAGRHDGPIHMLVTDVVMPRMSGGELARRMDELRPGIRVLYMSGYTENAIVHHGVLDSGTAFVQKPFHIETLTRAIREELDREVLTTI